MQEINLVPETELATSSQLKRKRLVIVLSSFVLGIFLVVVLGAFFAFTLSEKNKRDLIAQAKPIESKIAAFSRREWLIRATQSKASATQKLLQSQPPFRFIVSRLVELQPQGMSYSEISIAAPNRVTLSGRATGTPVLEKFLRDITAKEFGRKAFSDIVLQSLSRNERGEYEFSIRFTYIGNTPGNS